MKLFKLSFLFLALLSVAACGDDDDTIDCTQSDWIGTYAGSIDCDGTEEDVTVTITSSGTDNLIVIYNTTALETEFDPLPFTSCDLVANSSSGSLTLAINATLDGDRLTFNEATTVDGNTSLCSITATRN
jgi:hypothetical protein